MDFGDNDKMKNSTQKLVPQEFVDKNKANDDIFSIQTTRTDIKYQDIEYCLHNRNKSVYYNEHKQIDFQLAVAELESLDWALSQNGISFHNNKTDQSIFSHRLAEDKWLVLTPIKTDGVWTGYEWVSYPDTASLINVLKLYFDEIPWFNTLTWKEVKWTSDFGR